MKKTKRSGVSRVFALLLIIIVVSSSIIPVLADNEEEQSGRIIEFEQENPVHTVTVDTGVSVEELGLPETLRAISPLPDGQNPDEFIQAEPILDTSDGTEKYDYYYYGYVAPKGAEEMYQNGDKVLYTLSVVSEEGAEEVSYRLYGSIGGNENQWYACDASGVITGVIKSIPVTWKKGQYDPETAGEYTFRAQIANYTYGGGRPFAVVTVQEGYNTVHEEDDQQHGDSEELAECTCAYGKQETSLDHELGCAWYLYDCRCGGEEGHHTPECPQYTEVAEGCICGIDSSNRPWQHLEECPHFAKIECTCVDEEGEPLPEHDKENEHCMLYQEPVLMIPYSIGGGGSNDVASDNLMRTTARTTGVGPDVDHYGTIVPDSWVRYVNTIWMNKGFNRFAWTTSTTQMGTYNPTGSSYWKWYGTKASQTTGTVMSNSRRIPAVSSGVYAVYSVEQFWAALDLISSGQTIRLMANLNFNGMNYNWQNNYNTVGNSIPSNITLDGNGKTIYNLGITNGCGLFWGSAGFTVKNLTVRTAKLVTYANTDGYADGSIALFGSATGINCTNVKVYDSLVFGKNSVGALTFSTNPAANGVSKLVDSSNQNSYMYSMSHMGGIAAFPNSNTEITRCYAVNNLQVGTGAHSGGLLSCTDTRNYVKDSFAVNDCYYTTYAGGLQGMGQGAQIENCYSSGILEAYSNSGGLVGYMSFSKLATSAKNSYSTTLVGLRTQSKHLGGFASIISKGTSTLTTTASVSNCYAAGEVGSHTTDSTASATITSRKENGGFIAEYKNTSFSGCYYDKQTTAMREWPAGDRQTAVTGISGKLTTDTAKWGVGMANGSNFGLGTTNWSHTAEHYPQLKIFADATYWSGTTAELVKAYSKASTATVFLDTWDKGYDWSATGERSTTEVSYSRTTSEKHKGQALTYDTVREIVSDFPVTQSAGWQQKIPGGALTDVNGDGVADGGSMTVTSSGGVIRSPGMDWYTILEMSGSQAGTRSIRLFAYMGLEAGADKTVTTGELYNHRSDVKLTMMDRIVDDRVVGFHDNEIWSVSKQGGYPNSNRYWAVPTTNMTTSFPASQGAWLYTEIWRAKHDGAGGYEVDPITGELVPEWSVRVTGTGTGSNLTMDEQKWNGDEPVFLDITRGRKYIITYYWMLEDGRYRTDNKVITLKPTEYRLDLDVKNIRDSSVNNTALKLGAEIDSGASPAYTYTVNTESHAEKIQIPFASNATGAWQKKWPTTQVQKLQIDLLDAKGNVAGTQAISGTDLVEGATITVPSVKYYYLITASGREETHTQKVDVQYTVEKDALGGYYIRFNKLLNAPSDEDAGALLYGTSDGISLTDSTGAATQVYFNEMHYNTKITLWVKEGLPFEFIKVDEKGDPLTGVQFELYECTHTHDLVCGGILNPSACTHQHDELATDAAGCCWDRSNPFRQGTSGSDGKVTFTELPTGDYILAEVKTKAGYELPQGQWMLSVDTVNNTAQIQSRGDSDNLPPAFSQEAGTGILRLPNYKTVTLPYTGSRNTIFFTVGGVLMISIALMLYRSGRKQGERGRREGY